MKISLSMPVILCALLVACLWRSASADLIIDFSIDNGSTFSTSFEVVTGASLQVGVYLADTQAGGILETAGLFGFGLTASTSPTNLGAITAAAINPVFDFNITDDFTASTITWEDAVFLNTIPTGQAILLGTFTYDTTADGLTLFTFGHNDPGTVKWLAGDGTSVLGDTIFGVGAPNTFMLTINATAIPEPSSAVLVGIALIGAGFRRRRISI